MATVCTQKIISSLPETINDYAPLVASVMDLPAKDRVARLRTWIRSDLYFLMRYGLKRFDMAHPWIFARCREVQAQPNGMLDLWARDHYKSTIVTFGKTIQDILIDPEETIGIFSHTRPMAKAFLRQIKMELEKNRFLQNLFPDILYSEPQKQAEKWSEDEGITVRRKSNPKEATVEAWGLVDGQPISKHFRKRVYDDIVTLESVSSPDMIKKTTTAWEMSQNLGTNEGTARYVGTRYHFFDTYAEIMKRNSAIPRIHAATKNGTPEGELVFISEETNRKKRTDMGPYTYASQMLLNPTADGVHGFQEKWLRHYKNVNAAELNKYIIVDPANEKKRTNDYTTMKVIGLGQDKNYYILDIVRDRLNLSERTRKLFELHRKYESQGGILGVGYEKYGMQADTAHIDEEMERVNYRFAITELSGNMPKLDRIRRLIPLFEQGRIWFPQTCHRTNYEGRTEDLVQVFIEEEYKPFPVMRHDDMLDDLARIEDETMKAVMEWPVAGGAKSSVRSMSMRSYV